MTAGNTKYTRGGRDLTLEGFYLGAFFITFVKNILTFLLNFRIIYVFNKENYMGKVLEFPRRKKQVYDLKKMLDDTVYMLESNYNLIDSLHRKLAELETEVTKMEQDYNRLLGTYITEVGVECVPIEVFSYSTNIDVIRNKDGTWTMEWKGDPDGS